MGKLLIVAGPTASGKSALALACAQRYGGTVINADAMQCYRELRIITARPSPADEAAAPHRLYGVRAAAEPGDAAWWRAAALAELEAAKHGPARLPILCGGTGMYLAALLHGITDIPAPGEAARAEARALLAELGAAGLHARLAAVDPVTAARLRPGDSQRVARAWEVWRGTGKGLSAWQDQPAAPLIGWDIRMILLDPPRPALRAAIEARFEAMLAAGALEEVRALLTLGLDPALPLMRAHGVPELAAHLRGELSLEAAAANAVLATSRYTKRQATWFRHQKLVSDPAMQTIHARIDAETQFSTSVFDSLDNFMNNTG